ncbi:prephenate dehydrogenase [Solitalea koreensis]|uniref:Prephenate dehydrogenase n=1 Tax=Solitalea koreensis TaxID=543615 RepID=A0A521AEN1_9SPHI|nr:prephenate dehydrogenase [Solitalea koreensis]SMO33251.1 prephenate dehydrogenase [Solitalea koreensis]
MNLTVVGLGLIGGSLAKDLRSKGIAKHIIGVDKNPDHCNKAKELGIIDEFQPLDKAVANADLVIVSVPVNATLKVLTMVLDLIDDKTVVMDVGSTKSEICKVVENHPRRKNYVANHPIAGTEYSGPVAAIEGLYDKKTTIICDQDKSDPKAVLLIKVLHEAIGMHVIHMEAEEHDRHIAYVSHLSHVISYVLGKTVLEIEKDETNIFELAGSGFASTARLAKSNPDMWTPIFMQNKKSLLKAVDEYQKNLQEFRDLIAGDDEKALYNEIGRINDIRRVLEGLALKRAQGN